MIITVLIKLGEKAVADFDKYISDHTVEPLMLTYVKEYVEELKVAETGSSSRGGATSYEKAEWAMAISHFISDEFSNTPEFIELSHTIAKKYKKNINKQGNVGNEERVAAFWLERYLTNIINDKLENRLSENSIVELASLAISEMELAPREHKFIHHLKGIFLETELIGINDNVTIRKPQKSDLEFTRYALDYSPKRQHMEIPSSVLESMIETRNAVKCTEFNSRILDSLRLYKLGSVYSIHTTATTKTAIVMGGVGITWDDQSYKPNHKYTVKKEEIESFIQFVNHMEHKLDFDRGKKEHWSISVSIERYKSALLESVDVDRRLMTAVMGLESLFTFEGDVGENAYKLGMRVAKLLGTIGFDAEKIRGLVQNAYKYRNKVVHGSHIAKSLKENITEMLPDILNYLRISLIIFLINMDTEKNKMVGLLDEACISDDKNKYLIEIIEKSNKSLGKYTFS